MCEDLEAEMTLLAKRGVACSAVHQERWGSITRIRLPGGGEVGLYQPKHPTALQLGQHERLWRRKPPCHFSRANI